MRVGVADVLGGEDHEPPGHEDGVLPGIEHPGQIVQRRVRRRRALYEGADDVVVLFAPVAQRPLPHRPLDVPHLDAIRADRSDLQRVEQPPPVTTRQPQQVLPRLGRDLHTQLLRPTLEQLAQFPFGERAQPEHAGAREQRAVTSNEGSLSSPR